MNKTMHIVHREPCECYLSNLLSSLPKPAPSLISVESAHIKATVETLESYRSVIAVLKDQLAAAQDAANASKNE